jgi:IS605 OrfB family transposase
MKAMDLATVMIDPVPILEPVKAVRVRKRKARRPVTPTVVAPNKFAVTRYAVAPTRVRGYVLRAFPTEDQAHRFNQLIGQGRFLWNWLLDFQETSYAAGLSLHNKAGAVILNLAITQKLAAARAGAARVLTHPADPSMWGEHWLATCPRTLVTQKLDDLSKSWKRFFEKTGGRPKFKSRSTLDSIRFQVDPRKHDQSLAVHFPENGSFERPERVENAEGDSASGKAQVEAVFPAHFVHGRDPKDTWVKIPNVGRIRVELSEPVFGKIATITLRQRPVGRRPLARAAEVWAGYEIVLTAIDVPVEKDHPENWAKRLDWEGDSLTSGGAGRLGTGLGLLDPAGVVALDMSIPDRAVTSHGDRLGRRDTDELTASAHAKYLKRTKRDQRKLSRKARHRQREAGMGLKPTDEGYRGGSKQPVPLTARSTWSPAQKIAMRSSHRQRAVENRLAKERVAAKRAKTHDAHVFTTTLVLMFHTIVVEGLNLKGMSQGLNRAFRRGFNEAAMGEILRMLAYKCDLYGRTLVVGDQWFPSSKRCHGCHHINHDLKLRDREWDCAGCGRHHERDPNATFNLWQEGCSAVGIPLNGQLIPDNFHAPSTGQSPGIGRRGLGPWIGFTETSADPKTTSASEASRGRHGSLVSTKIPSTRRARALRVG